MDTIVALSSGRPPAAIAVVRISGLAALAAVERLAGPLPVPRRAGLRSLRDGTGALLDRALVLVFPAPGSATGEDLVELHCHGGRAVVAAVEAALRLQPGLRAAEPGEFTRRALMNGRIDLAQAEGLADLLEAETEGQRRAALAASEGQVSRAIRGWLDRLADIAARIEATLDFAEEGDVGAEGAMLGAAMADAATLRADMLATLASPPVERVRDGLRVVIAGPPNSGKSTLLNLMTAREAAIVSPHPGTTRDPIEAPIQRDGVAYLLTDTAGLTDAVDPVERIGVSRAEAAVATADILLWLGDDVPPRANALWVHARADMPERRVVPKSRDASVSHDDQASIDLLWDRVTTRAGVLLPIDSDLPLKVAQREACARAASLLCIVDNDMLVIAERVRLAAGELGRILGINATEAVLDALFTRFCLGK